MQYVVDTHALRVRLAVDGRTMGIIAKDAKLPPETIKDVLSSGKAEKDVIDKIRLALRPRMFFSTICPPELQEADKPGTSINGITPEQAKNLIRKDGDYIKRTIELSKKIEALCKEYSTMEVFDTINEMQFHILAYVEQSGFNLLELLDESMSGVPEFVLNDKNELQYIEKRRKANEKN